MSVINANWKEVSNAVLEVSLESNKHKATS